LVVKFSFFRIGVFLNSIVYHQSTFSYLTEHKEIKDFQQLDIQGIVHFDLQEAWEKTLVKITEHEHLLKE